MSIVIISFTCCFLQIYDDFYGPFFNDISGGILNDYLHIRVDHQIPAYSLAVSGGFRLLPEKEIFLLHRYFRALSKRFHNVLTINLLDMY